MRRNDIKSLAIGVIEEYGTNDPFKLIQSLGLYLLYHDLPDTVNAYRLDNIIVLNSSLAHEMHKWLLAHELGHYLIHGEEATLGRFIKNNLLIKNKIEKEADLFASELLLVDIEDYVIEGLTCEQLSTILAVPEEYVKYKLAK